MKVVADLHLHSKYSRAVSSKMTLPIMAEYAQIKGINLLSTGDFTHPEWVKELDSCLEEVASGMYKIGNTAENVRYILGTEISCIFTQGGKGRRIHLLVFAPNLKTVHKINLALKKKGCNLNSDGRPIIGLSAIELCETLFSISEEIVVIPAHIWTPWFGLLGSKSGFDSLRESCDKYAEKIYAVETGLSSDPAMNWKIAELNKRSIVSFSDAHSPEKLGRELTVFESSQSTELTYQSFAGALKGTGKWRIVYTIEFYPEEGKYHVDGHRLCGVWQLPHETRQKGKTCHVCGKPLTLGVLGRVEELAQGKKIIVEKKKDNNGVMFYHYSSRPPYAMLVPLQEIVAEALQKGVKTKAVTKLYDVLVKRFGSELEVLMEVKTKDLMEYDTKLAEAVKKVRSGDIFVQPGYDGVFGTVKIWSDGSKEVSSKEQMYLFDS
ncbi:MAG: endonuclease Q family protein [Patescibacteria group bacterium]|jgi:uncharacterized protein (TIGR00375 family)